MALRDGLPDFLQFNAPKTALRILPDGSGWRVEDESIVYPLLSKAYDHVHEERFAEAVFETEDDEGFYMEDGTNRMLLSFTAGGDRVRAVEEYEEFLAIAATYRAAAAEFFNAYQFINTHPVFWYHVKHRNGDLDWDYNGYANGQNALDVYRDDATQEVCFLIEPVIYEGTKRLRGQQVLDTDLVVIAGSFEAAIIALAERIDRYYDETGAAREGVAHTAYTQHLIERIDAAKG